MNLFIILPENYIKWLSLKLKKTRISSRHNTKKITFYLKWKGDPRGYTNEFRKLAYIPEVSDVFNDEETDSVLVVYLGNIPEKYSPPAHGN